MVSVTAQDSSPRQPPRPGPGKRNRRGCGLACGAVAAGR